MYVSANNTLNYSQNQINSSLFLLLYCYKGMSLLVLASQPQIFCYNELLFLYIATSHCFTRCISVLTSQVIFSFEVYIIIILTKTPIKVQYGQLSLYEPITYIQAIKCDCHMCIGYSHLLAKRDIMYHICLRLVVTQRSRAIWLCTSFL